MGHDGLAILELVSCLSGWCVDCSGLTIVFDTYVLLRIRPTVSLATYETRNVPNMKQCVRFVLYKWFISHCVWTEWQW